MHHPGTPWPVFTRVSYIVSFEELRKQHPRLSARRFCEATEVPYPTFARWWAAYRRQRARGLQDRSRRPRRSPAALAPVFLDRIRLVHRRLGLGVRRLHAYLRQAGLISCSLSTVYRVLRRAGALVRRPRKPKPIWQRYAKAWPGERAQMDLKYLPQGRFQVTLIDDCSRSLAATVVTKRTTQAVCQALPQLLQALPFPLRCLQTDNGSEFGKAFTQLLRQQGIRHTRIRPRSPHLNGKVERVQRTVQEEYWDGVNPGSLDAWERGLQAYVRFYNRQRLHSALGYTPPARYAHERLLRARGISHMS
jgi:transposase InsO family protein